MSHNCSSVDSPAVTLVKGKLSVQGFNDAKLQGHQPCRVAPKIWTIHQKVCCYTYCPKFAEIHSVFKVLDRALH
jgi:hypothetical protein